MISPLRIELPGLDADQVARAVPRDGQLGRGIPPDAIVEVAERTLAASDPALTAALEAAAGLSGRIRRRRTPFALRALALAVADGRLGAHQDLRLAMPLAPDQDLGTDSYRYRGFQQEAPVATFHCRSANTSRWDIHHLWHATQGFVWKPAMARATRYTSTRLNEAACETHWFFLEGMLSPRCREHRRFDPATQTHWPDCPACDAAGERADAVEALALARAGLRFWDSEAASCDLIQVTHRVTPNPLAAPIENWLEAWRYVRHHQQRLTSPPFRAWVEGFLSHGGDYHDGVTQLRDRIAARLAALLVAPITVDLDHVRSLQARRILQDAAQRLLQAVHLGHAPARALAPIHDALAAVNGAADAAGAAAAAWRGLLAAAEVPGCEEALTLGYDLRQHLGEAPPGNRGGELARRLAGDGLLHTALERHLDAELPITAAAATRAGGRGALARTVAAMSEFVAGVQPLAVIASAALASEQPALHDLARYERLLRAAGDERALAEDLFAVDAAGVPLGDDRQIRLNPSLDRQVFDHDVAALARGEAADKRTTHVFAGTHLGRPLVEVADDLAVHAALLKRPRRVGELLDPEGGALAGLRPQLEDWIARGLVVVLHPDAG